MKDCSCYFKFMVITVNLIFLRLAKRRVRKNKLLKMLTPIKFVDDKDEKRLIGKMKGQVGAML